MYVNLIVADRLAPLARASGPEDEIIERYRSVVEPYAGRIRFAVAAFFAVVMGSGVVVRVAGLDPLLARDEVRHQGSAVPSRTSASTCSSCRSCEFIAGWTFAALLVILIVTLVFHYLNGGIRLQTPFQRVTPQVKVHISVILALMALTKTVQYYLARFGLTLSHRGVVDGATYTDVKAQLPGAQPPDAHLGRGRDPVHRSTSSARVGCSRSSRSGLWGFISIVVGTIYPAVIQRFVVQPNEYAREQTYIERNIAATRSAFGLDKIQTKPFDYNTNLTPKDVASPRTSRRSRTRGSGIPTRSAQVLAATEEFQPFYSFSDVDVDRYNVNGQATQTLSGVRELDSSQLPSNTWTNRHLVYTHGYGIDTAHARTRTPATSRATCSPTSRRSGELRDSRSPTCTSARGSAAIRSSTARWPSKRPTARAPRRPRKYYGTGGVKVGGLRAPARVRAAVRRLQPRVLGPGHDRSRASSTCATSRSACRPRRRSCNGTPIRTR